MTDIYLRIINSDKVTLVGSWSLPSEKIDNFDAQQDIGWHIFLAMHKGANKIEIVHGNIDDELEYNEPLAREIHEHVRDCTHCAMAKCLGWNE